MALGAWHTEEVSKVFDHLKTGEHGLPIPEAEQRLKKDGPNALPAAKADNYLTIFIRQFESPLIYILLGASVVILAIGEYVDGTIILGVLLFNAIVGTVQEGRAKDTLRALRTFVDTKATVLRSGREFIIPDVEIVRGDVVVLQEGDKVPADARLMRVQSLRVDESTLTGESQPVPKVRDILTDEKLPIADRKNMVFKGTNVVAGNGVAVVVSTGAETEVGRIAKNIVEYEAEIPLQANIRYLSRLIIIVVAVIATAMFLLGVAKGFEVTQMFTTVVSLTVSVIPEGLPIVMTLVLATGVMRMSKRHALVKRLQAVEALGQARIIAVDKTGTLTRNELVVQKVYAGGRLFEVEGSGYEPSGTIMLNGKKVVIGEHPELHLAASISGLSATARVVYSEAEKRWLVSGDPTEAAMLVFAEKAGLQKGVLETNAPLVEEVPFESSLQYHASVRHYEKGHALFVVGAPEAILARSKFIIGTQGGMPLSDAQRSELEDIFLALSSDGLRVIGIAEKRSEGRLSPENPKDLSFVAFLAMKDGLRKEVPKALARAHSAGIRVVMITGDHRATAEAIGREAGIYKEGDSVMTGAEIDKHSDLVLKEKIARVTIFARVAPEHKLRIIRAYRARGEIVAMTGDGVNDAPSLVAADLGVAMGGIGTEVAKEASDIVLLDDNFGSIVSAVEEGRGIYKSIRKVVLYLFSTSVGEVIAITGALIASIPLPLLPAQIIWLNFVTDPFLDAALAMDPKERGLLSGRFERPKKYIIDKLMTSRMIVMAIPMGLGSLFLFSQYYEGDMTKAWTMSLTVLAVFQWFNAWNCRSEEKSIFTMNPFSNLYLVGATGIVVVLQLLAIYTPFLQGILNTTALNLNEWFIVIALASSVVLAEEARKFLYRIWYPKKAFA